MFLLQAVADTVATLPTPTTSAELVWYLVSLGVGALVGHVLKLLEKASTLVNGLSEPLKLGIIAVLTFGVVKLETLLGVQLPDNPLNWNPENVNMALTATAALGLRFGKKKNTTPPTA